MRNNLALKADISLAQALRHTAETFRRAGIEQPALDAHLLVGHALDLDRTQLIVQAKRTLAACEIKVISVLAARRLKHEPVARILGRQEFWSLSLKVTPDVLVPRPETETVVEAVLDHVASDARRMEKYRILDIGTGSGALLLALLSELPNATGVGTDINFAALHVARANVQRHGLAARCYLVACDIADAITGPFDFIVSNPPYVRSGDIAALASEVRDYDPKLALDGGADGLSTYRAIAGNASRLLTAGGRFIVELGAGQETAVRELLCQAGLTACRVRKDLAGIPRALSAMPRPMSATHCDLVKTQS